MIDWNDDGKIDPVEVGMSLWMLEESDQKKQRNGGGCLTICILAFAMVSGFALIVRNGII